MVGNNVFRVSDVLKLCYPNSLDFVEQYHLDEGTRKHKLMEIHGNNQVYGYKGEVGPEIQPMVDWLEKEQVIIESCEEWVEHKSGVGGHPDCLLIWKGKEHWVDWKFAETITEQNQMQGCAYTYITGRPGFFLQCSSKGKPKAVRCKPNPYLLATFLSALNVLKFHEARKPAPIQYSSEQISIMAQEAKEGMESLCQNP